MQGVLFRFFSLVSSSSLLIASSGVANLRGCSDDEIATVPVVYLVSECLFKENLNPPFDSSPLDISLPQEGSALVSGGKDNNVMIWDVVSACNGQSRGAIGDSKHNGTGPAAPINGDKASSEKSGKVGTKRKARLWSSTEDDSSVGPVHIFATRNTGVYR